MTAFSSLFGGGGGNGSYTVPHAGYLSGKYHIVTPRKPGGGLTNTSTTSGHIYFTPFYIFSDVTISAFCFQHGSSAENGKKARIGIYSMSSGMRAVTLLGACAEMTMTSSSGVREGALSLSLPKGWYVGSLTSDGLTFGGHLLSDTPPEASWGNFAYDTAADFVGFSGDWLNSYNPGSYAALPSTAGAPTSRTNSPYFYIKVA